MSARLRLVGSASFVEMMLPTIFSSVAEEPKSTWLATNSPFNSFIFGPMLRLPSVTIATEAGEALSPKVKSIVSSIVTFPPVTIRRSGALAVRLFSFK